MFASTLIHELEDLEDDEASPPSLAHLARSGAMAAGGREHARAGSVPMTPSGNTEAAYDKYREKGLTELDAKEVRALFRRPFDGPDKRTASTNAAGKALERAHWLDVVLAVAAVERVNTKLSPQEFDDLRRVLASRDNYRVTTAAKNRNTGCVDFKMCDTNYVRELFKAVSTGEPMIVKEGSQWHAKLKHQLQIAEDPRLPPSVRRELLEILRMVKVVPKDVRANTPSSTKPTQRPAQQRRDGHSDMRRTDNRREMLQRGRNVGRSLDMRLASNRAAFLPAHRNVDGTPDMRFSINRAQLGLSSAGGPLNMDGTPDMRFSVHRVGLGLSSVGAPLNMDGTPDMRFSAHRVGLGLSSAGAPLNMDGTPDMRFSAHRAGLGLSSAGAPLKMDGTPDMRYAANKAAFGGK